MWDLFVELLQDKQGFLGSIRMRAWYFAWFHLYEALLWLIRVSFSVLGIDCHLFLQHFFESLGEVAIILPEKKLLICYASTAHSLIFLKWRLSMIFI